MRTRELQSLKKELLKLRAKIQKQIKYYEEQHFKTTLKEKTGEISSHATHPADQVLPELEHENAYVLASKERELLYAVDEALARIEDGTYGICVICEKEIGIERLKAVPWAELCVECQKKLEEEEKKEESPLE